MGPHSDGEAEAAPHVTQTKFQIQRNWLSGVTQVSF